MDSAEFTYWMGYFGIEPWGEEWLQTGNICQMIYEANRGKHSKKRVPDDWVYRPLAKARKEQTPAEMMQMLMTFADVANQAEKHNGRLRKQTQHPPLGKRR